MKGNPVAPTVHHVQHAAKLEVLLRDAKALSREMADAEKMNVKRAWDLGHLLRQAKDVCPHGEWEAKLEGIGLTKTTATRYMRIAKCVPGHICQFASIKAALKFLSLQAKSIIPPDGTREPGDESENEPAVPLIYCRPCRVGVPKPNCPDCKKLRQERARSERPKRASRVNGAPLLVWHNFHNKAGELIRSVDHIAHAGEPKHMGKAEDLIGEFGAWIKRVMAFYEQVTGQKAPEA